MTPLTLAIIEPVPVVGLGLTTFFSGKSSGFSLTGVYRDISSFRRLCPKEVDVILFDMALVGISPGLNIRKILADRGGSLIMALTDENIPLDVLASFDGLVNMHDECPTMARQITSLVERSRSYRDDTAGRPLSRRETAMIIAIAKGDSNKEIAQEMQLSEHSVKTYRKTLSQKIRVRGAIQFAAYAIKHRLIDVP